MVKQESKVEDMVLGQDLKDKWNTEMKKREWVPQERGRVQRVLEGKKREHDQNIIGKVRLTKNK